MLQAIAKERRMPVVHVNQVGGNDQLVSDGSSTGWSQQHQSDLGTGLGCFLKPLGPRKLQSTT